MSATAGVPHPEIDAQLAALDDWRGDLVRRLRALVAEVEPDLAEDWRWRTGVWTLDGRFVCAYAVFAHHVKVNFAEGAALDAPEGALTSGFDAKRSRAVDLRAGDFLDTDAMTDVLHRAVAHARR